MPERRQDPVPAGLTCLVTGGGSGIGRATVLRMAAEGGEVLVADVDLEAARVVAAEAGVRARAVHLDQADPSSVETVVGDLDRLDGCCVNAAVAPEQRPFDQIPLSEWDSAFAVNVRGAVIVARAAAPLLRRARGSLLFTGSTTGVGAPARHLQYGTSKAALLTMARGIALELAGDGVRVNTVVPGAVRTPLLEAGVRERGTSMDDLTTPLGGIAEPEDVAAALCFLGSGDSAHITGVELVIDGGGQWAH